MFFILYNIYVYVKYIFSKKEVFVLSGMPLAGLVPQK